MNIKLIGCTLSAFAMFCVISPASAQAGGAADKVQAAAAAYGLAKNVIGDISNLAKGPSQCVRHFYNHSKQVWFVKGASLGDGNEMQYAIVPGQAVPVYYNGKGGPLE